jgi:hemolysin D
MTKPIQALPPSRSATRITRSRSSSISRATVAQSTIQVEDKTVNLSAGMNVTVEIKTGQRRLVEFFLSSLFRAGRESLRER